MDKDALGSQAGRADIEREAEDKGFGDKVEIRIGANHDGVGAAEFHRGRNEMRSELLENLLAGLGAAGEQNFVGTRLDGGARGFGGFGKERDEWAVEAGTNTEFYQRKSGRGAADTGL